MARRKTLPVGLDDFRELRESNKYYVDKTAMIQDFIEYEDEVALIIRPRRFGKTLNMTMIRDFFDITQDSRAIFEGLEIMRTEYAEEINSRPVIYFTFKDCNAENPEELAKSLCRIMYAEYEHYYQAAVKKKEEIPQFALFEKIYGLIKAREATLSDLRESIALLMEIAAQTFGQSVILLLDEYDTPIMSSHENGYHNKVSGFITDFYGSALKGQKYLGNALLTGIQRVAKESIFSKLNNIIVYTVLDEQYAGYFGLTPEESAKMLGYYGLELNESVRLMYDGYRIGSFEMYNPWSMTSYCLRKKPMSYWVNTSSNSLIRKCLNAHIPGFMEKQNELFEKGSVEVLVNLETAYTELESAETLWGLFINAGYLTVWEEISPELLRVAIPNREVKGEFQKIVTAAIGVGSGDFLEMTTALMTGNLESFKKIYQSIVRNCVSYYDVADTGGRYENPYHMLTLGMVLSLDYLYDIKSNYESGDGRADIKMVSRQPQKRAHIVMEFKRTDDLEKGAEAALQQIFDKRYSEDLIERTKTEGGEVLCMGIAHDSKKCEIRTRML